MTAGLMSVSGLRGQLTGFSLMSDGEIWVGSVVDFYDFLLGTMWPACSWRRGSCWRIRSFTVQLQSQEGEEFNNFREDLQQKVEELSGRQTEFGGVTIDGRKMPIHIIMPRISHLP